MKVFVIWWIPLIVVATCGGKERGWCAGREAGL